MFYYKHILRTVTKLNGELNKKLIGDILYKKDNVEYFTPTTSSQTYTLSQSIHSYEKLLIQGINNNGIRFWRLVSANKGSGVTDTTVKSLFSLTLILPISSLTTGAIWLQSSIFESNEDGTQIITGSGCQLRLGSNQTSEKKHYVGIVQIIGLK